MEENLSMQDPALEIDGSKVTDEDRNRAINALKGITGETSSFKPKERQSLNAVKNGLSRMMEELGYDVKNPACIAAMAAFVENIGRAFPK